MAITQIRMLALITAAEDYQSGYTGAIAAVRSAARMVETQEWTADEALTHLAMTLTELAPVRTESAVQIALERQHFKHMSKKNDYSRDYMRQRRFRELANQDQNPGRGRGATYATKMTPQEALRSAAKRFTQDPNAMQPKDVADLTPGATANEILDIGIE